MLGLSPNLTSQLAAERSARFAADAAEARRRRLLHQPHPAPRCRDLAGQLPDVVVDLRPQAPARTEPAATA